MDCAKFTSVAKFECGRQPVVRSRAWSTFATSDAVFDMVVRAYTAYCASNAGVCRSITLMEFCGFSADACEGDGLAGISQDGEQGVGFVGGSQGCDSSHDLSGVPVVDGAEYDVGARGGDVVGPDRVVDDVGLVDGSDAVRGDVGGVGAVGLGDQVVVGECQSEVVRGADGGLKKSGRKKPGQRQRRRLRAMKQSGDQPGDSVPIWRVGAKPSRGFCETVASQSPCPSYGTALVSAEQEARESLARRRAAENAVAEKLARMKLASLEDEKRCQEYADLKHSRIVQWTNEAIAKSQESLEKSKSIDPGSSNSQYEIRQQARKVIDLEEQVRHLTQVATLPGTVEERIAAMQQLENHETTSEYVKAQADCWGDMRPGSVDPGSDDFKVTVPYRPGRFRVLRNSELDSDLRL